MNLSSGTRARRAFAFGIMALLGAWCLAGPSRAGADVPTPTVVADVAADSVAPPPTQPASGEGATSDDPLAPASTPPWNPPRAVDEESTGEAIARFPIRLLGLPFSLLGRMTEAGLGFVEDADAVPRVALRLAQLQALGITLGAVGLGDRVGWAGGVAYAPPQLPFLKMSAAGSTTGYTRTSFALIRNGTGIAYQFDWRPRDPFYGIGRFQDKDNVSNYAARIEAVKATLDLTKRLPPPDPSVMLDDPAEETKEHLPVRREVLLWAGPRDVRLSDGRDPRRPSIEETFPLLESQLGTKMEHFIYGAHLGVDTREGRPHWSRGWRLAADVERYDKAIEAFAIDDAGTPASTFTKLVYEGEFAWSFYKDPRTIRLYGRVQDLRSFSNEGTFLVSDLSRLGGNQGLAGFEPGRFHDADLIVGKVSYIVPLMRYLEVDFHGEAGNVFRQVQEAQWSDLEASFGFLFRIRSARAPLIATGIEGCREGIRFRFAFGGIE